MGGHREEFGADAKITKFRPIRRNQWILYWHILGAPSGNFRVDLESKLPLEFAMVVVFPANLS